MSSRTKFWSFTLTRLQLASELSAETLFKVTRWPGDPVKVKMSTSVFGFKTPLTGPPNVSEGAALRSRTRKA